MQQLILCSTDFERISSNLLNKYIENIKGNIFQLKKLHFNIYPILSYVSRMNLVTFALLDVIFNRLNYLLRRMDLKLWRYTRRGAIQMFNGIEIFESSVKHKRRNSVKSINAITLQASMPPEILAYSSHYKL